MSYVMLRRPGMKKMYKDKFIEKSPDTTDQEFEQFWRFCKSFWLGGALLFAVITVLLIVLGLTM